MHALHLIAVEAEDKQEAISAAESALDEFGEDEVYDYYTVGGGWSRLFHGNAALCYCDDSELFRRSVAEVIDQRNNVFLSLRDEITGRQIVADELPVETADRPGVAERISRHNAEKAEFFRKAMVAEHLPKNDSPYSTLGHNLYTLGKLLAGYYCFDSHFYDAASYSTGLDSLWDRCEQRPEKQWLIAVDLHF